MKKIYSTILLSCMVIVLQGQVIISGNHVPQPGDTIRKSTSYNLNGMDYTLAGPDQTWDFTGLTAMVQQIDTFISPGDTPQIMQFVFNNIIFQEYKATVVEKVSGFDLIPNFEIPDTYQFFKKTSNDYRMLGYGINLMGTAIPIPFQQIDTLYRYPLEYGEVDSSHSYFSLDVPNLGYIGGNKTRTNFYEGWGTLRTPYGEFQTLKLKTVIHEYDSIYIDSLNMGLPLTRDYTEYKWFSEDYGHPIMQISEEGAIVSATYMDSVRNVLTSLPENPSRSFSYNIYPNPATDNITVSYELFAKSDVEIALYSINGRKIRSFFRDELDRGLYNKIIYLRENGIQPGIYLLRLQVNNFPKVKKLVLK